MDAQLDLWRAPGHLIRRAQQVHSLIWADEVGPVVTSVQFAVMNTLRAEAGLDQRTLGQRIGADRSTVADVAGRLERNGIVTQARDPADGRRRVLKLTEEGVSLHARLVPVVKRVELRLLEGFSGLDRDAFLSLLSRIVLANNEGVVGG